MRDLSFTLPSYRMINKFLARTTSKLYAVRRLYFYLAVLLYNVWVMLNHSKGKIVADSLKLYAIVALTLSFMPDIESGG